MPYRRLLGASGLSEKVAVDFWSPILGIMGLSFTPKQAVSSGIQKELQGERIFATIGEALSCASDWLTCKR